MLTREQIERCKNIQNNPLLDLADADALAALVEHAEKMMAAYTTADGVYVPPGEPVFYGLMYRMVEDHEDETGYDYAVNDTPEEMPAPTSAGWHYSYEDTLYMSECFSSKAEFIKASKREVKRQREKDAEYEAARATHTPTPDQREEGGE